MICDFIVVSSFLTQMPPHHSYALRIIDIRKCAILFGLSQIIITALAFMSQDAANQNYVPP